MPNFKGNEDLRKLGKEYLNASLCKFVVYSLQHSETFDISHVFLQLTIAELATLKQVRFFWPTLYILDVIFVFVLIVIAFIFKYIYLHKIFVRFAFVNFRTRTERRK